VAKSGNRPPHLSAGVVVVRRDADEWICLLLRAFRNWDFPKGMVEVGEEPLMAARREVREETTIDDLQFAFGEQHIETGPYSHNKVARYYIASTRIDAITLPVNPELGTPEHHEWRWVSFTDARTMVSPRVAPVLEWALAQLAAGAVLSKSTDCR
jgi:8-oxo-dGTP pyrophosphatase MutT (NUDIX family)